MNLDTTLSTPLLPHLSEQAEVLVCGASRGIGLACCEQLLKRADVERVWALARSATTSPGLQALSAVYGERLQRIDGDAQDEAALAAVATQIRSTTSRLHVVLSTVGILHSGAAQAEKNLLQMSRESLLASFLGNAVAPALLLKHLLPLLRGHHACTFAALSARVGSISDNRLGGWYGYRASKAALNQLLHTASIELKRLNPNATVLALHPGTTDTELSKPFQANVPAEKLFSTAYVATRLLELLATHGPEATGTFWAWDGQPIAW